jgi:hypothetical protein
MFLIEQDDVKGRPFQCVDVSPDQPIGREHDFTIAGVQRRISAAQDADLQFGGEAREFLLPVEQQARRGDDEMRTVHAGRRPDQPFLNGGQQTDRLERFPQSHVIGQTGAEPVLVEKREPAIAVHLIGAQRRVHASWKRGYRDPLKFQKLGEHSLIFHRQ